MEHPGDRESPPSIDPFVDQHGVAADEDEAVLAGRRMAAEGTLGELVDAAASPQARTPALTDRMGRAR